LLRRRKCFILNPTGPVSGSMPVEIREKKMNRRNILATSAITAAAIAFAPASALAQHKSLKRQLVGTWTLVSWDQTLPDGTKLQRFGASPRGVNVFTSDGHFFLMIERTDLPKIASNDPMNPSPDEAKAITVGSIAYYGKYSVNARDKTVSLTVEGTTLPNQMDTPQKRVITSISATDMQYSNMNAVGGRGQISLVWKRAM
jgi:hypothetical protein